MKRKIGTKVDFVYFDLGHVIIPVNRDRLVNLLSEVSDLPKKRIIEMLGRGYESADRRFWDIVCDFDRGRLYPHEFYRKVKRLLRLHVGFNRFVEIWQSMLDVDKKFLGILSSLYKQGIGRGIISDLCLIHYQRFAQMVPQGYFNIRYFSFMEDRLKWEDDGETFRRAAVAARTSYNRMLFIDDRMNNLEVAQRYGIMTFHYKDNFDELVDFMRSLGLKV